MTYWLNLFSPETYEAFSASDRNVTGFPERQRKQAEKVKPGDKFVCYLTRVSRWVGVFEVIDGPFHDDTPIFYEEDDRYVVRFHVRPLVWLPKEKAVPIHEDHVWNQLEFTRDHEQGSTTWTGMVRISLRELGPADGQFLEEILQEQAGNGETYPVEESQWRRYVSHRVRRLDGVVSVTVPEDDGEESKDEPAVDVRESIKIQALLSRLGADMGFSIWVPNNDRSRVEGALQGEKPIPFLDLLPLNYDDTTLKTIEQIDVLWLRGRAIVRAFEIEHTTAVYSGILRMADLLALQPNMDIRLHIVAPESRKEKVFTEIRRPVFSLLDRGPLAETCKYLSYDALRELSDLPHVQHMSDSVLDDYTEDAQ